MMSTEIDELCYSMILAARRLNPTVYYAVYVNNGSSSAMERNTFHITGLNIRTSVKEDMGE